MSSHSAHFKWFNGQSTRRFEIRYESATDLFDSLVAKITNNGFVRGQEDVFWIDSDGEPILLEDGESMQEALNLNANEAAFLLESGAAEDVLGIGEKRSRSRGRRSRPHSRGRTSRSRGRRSCSNSSSSDSSTSTDSYSSDPYKSFRRNWTKSKSHRRRYANRRIKIHNRKGHKEHSRKRWRSPVGYDHDFGRHGPFPAGFGCGFARGSGHFPRPPSMQYGFPPRSCFPPFERDPAFFRCHSTFPMFRPPAPFFERGM